MNICRGAERSLRIFARPSKNVSAHHIQSRMPRIGWECKTRRRATTTKNKMNIIRKEVDDDDGEKEEKKHTHTSVVCARLLDASVLGGAVVVN